METEWKKGHSSDTKYPKKAFSGIISAMYPSSTESKNTPLLRVDFEDGKTISLFGLKVEEGEVKASMGLEEFLESLNKLGIEDFWATETDSALGFRTEPNLVGCKAWMRPMENTTIGDPTQTQSSVFWGLLEKYEKPVSTPVPKSNPKAKPVPALATLAKESILIPDATAPGFDAVSALKDFLLEFLSEPKTEAAILQAVRKLENGKQMNDVRKPVLSDRTFISVENGKYSLVV